MSGKLLYGVYVLQRQGEVKLKSAMKREMYLIISQVLGVTATDGFHIIV